MLSTRMEHKFDQKQAEENRKVQRNETKEEKGTGSF
jgi:hypothetical protein